MKTVSKCLACMKGYWDPEFEPSVYNDSHSLLCLASLWGGGGGRGSLVQSGTWHNGRLRSRLGQPVHSMCPNIMQYGACTVC